MVLLIGCARPPDDDEPRGATCPVEPPGPGEVVVARLCNAAAIPDGDGVGADWILANSRFRAVLRHPQASLTLAGLGGGTIVDAAPWDAPDRLHEVAPLVNGGWLVLDDIEVGDDHVTLRGVLRALPDRPVEGEGSRHEVTWSIRPDEPWLHLDGADGLWLHPSAEPRLVGGWAVHDRVVYGHDGHVEADLGGALRIADATGLLVAPPRDAWAETRTRHMRIAGTAPGADAVEALYDGTPVAILPVLDGRFDAEVPAWASGVRAVATGRPPSPVAPPGDDLDLRVGPPATLRLHLGWRGLTPRPARVRWLARDGRSGDARLEPEGGVLALGAGVVDLEVSAGPWVFPRRLRVELEPDEVEEVHVGLNAAVAPTTHILADLWFRGTRSRAVRASDLVRARNAVAAGLDLVVFTAEDVVEEGDAWLDDAGWLRWEAGATLTSPAGWNVGAWPWRPDDRRSGRGAPRVADLPPEEALLVAWGGDAGRTTLVDLAWMRAVATPPHALPKAPDFVELGPPGEPPFDAWSPWFRWLDAGRFVRPSGPRVWIDVTDRANHGAWDIRRGLVRGWLSAGTGALVRIAIDGEGAGGVIRPPEPADTDAAASFAADTDAGSDTDGPTLHHVTVEVDRGAEPLDRLSIVTQGRGVVAEVPIGAERIVWTGDLELGRWTLAVAWSTTAPNRWATCMPVWLGAPSDGTVPGDPAQ